jgi:glycosyltransferase involved in cell wall biosynthesis
VIDKKVILIHPPMYPISHEFYNLIAQKVNLVVYQVGEYPLNHTHWTNDFIRKEGTNYKLKIYSHGAVNFKKTINPSFIYDLIKEKPDIVVSIAFWMPSLYLSLIKNILKFKFIILTNMIEETEKNIGYSKETVRKLIASKVDCFISASNLTTQYLSEMYPSKNIVLSMQTMNVTRWRDDLDSLLDKKILLEKLNIPGNIKVMLGVGNYIHKKNWISVLKSMQNIDNVLFILIGSGEDKNIYIDMVKEFEIYDKVRIVGNKIGVDLLEYYKVSDFLIFPSFYDQFGFVVPEALTSGLPVICSINTGASSLILNGVNGLLVDPRENMIDAIKYTVKNLDDMQYNTEEHISKYTLENRADEFVNIFNSC